MYLTSSQYGDGDGAIIYSNLDCKGFENDISACNKSSYGEFTCSRNNVVAIKCKDSEFSC